MTARTPEQTAAATSDEVLDNAGWHALIGPHASFAQGGGRVRRYDPDVSVFHAAVDDSEEAWRELAALATPEGIVVVFRAPPVTPPAGWVRVFGGHGHQMVPAGAFAALPELPTVDPGTGRRVTLRSLGVDDLDAMIAIVALTEPGPFRPRTIELGGYIGIFHDDELVAMAGQRLRPPGHCEISAVCTHPDSRRRGYASIVTAHVANAIAERGEAPFLHVASNNTSGRALYEHLGFTRRRVVSFSAFRVSN